MIIQYNTASPIKQPAQYQLVASERQGYYAAVPAELLDDQSNVIDELINFAFDTLGASRLHVRVYDDATASLLLESER